MSQPEKDAGGALLGHEAVYAQHLNLAKLIKGDFLELYRQMVANLSTVHLEPFAKILLECDNSALKQDQQLIESLRQNLLHALEQKMDSFWTDFDVANNITSLEMLKEKFREFEGTDWNLQSKNPHQRTLPTRMHFKQMQQRHLQKQLQFQNAQLEDVINANEAHRARIRQVEQERIRLREMMERRAADFAAAKPVLMRLMSEVVRTGRHKSTAP